MSLPYDRPLAPDEVGTRQFSREVGQMKQRRVCLESGYKYEYEGPARGRWKSSSDERWETVDKGAVCGKLVGHRRIDGAPVTVVRAGKKLYAATHATRGLPPNRARPGSRFV